MSIIYLAYGVLTLLIALLIYKSYSHKFFKALSIVTLVTLGLGLEEHYRTQLGSPIGAEPPNGFVYVHHEVQSENIYIWVWVPEVGNRLYYIPYDQEKAEKLAEAQGEGSPQQGTFTTSQNGEGNDSETSLEFDDWHGDYTGGTKDG